MFPYFYPQFCYFIKLKGLNKVKCVGSIQKERYKGIIFRIEMVCIEDRKFGMMCETCIPTCSGK